MFLEPKLLRDTRLELNASIADLDNYRERLALLDANKGPRDTAFRESRRSILGQIADTDREIAEIRSRLEPLESVQNSAQKQAEDAKTLVGLGRLTAAWAPNLADHARKIEAAAKPLIEAFENLNVEADAYTNAIATSLLKLAPDDPDVLGKSVGPTLAKMRAHDTYYASAIAALFVKIIEAADIDVAMADHITVNPHSIPAGVTFSKVAAANGKTITERLTALLAANGVAVPTLADVAAGK